MAKIALARKTDTRSPLGFGGGVSSHSWRQPRLAGVGPGLQRSQTAGGGGPRRTGRSPLGFGGGVSSHSWRQPRLAGVGPGLQRSQTAGGGDPVGTTISP